MTTTTPRVPKYQITLTVDGKTIKGSGASVLEALEAIEKPVKITTKGVLKVKGNRKKAEMTFQPVRIKRLFYPLAQRLVAKQLELLMK